jgi:pre-rRNA-processing protein TSR4
MSGQLVILGIPADPVCVPAEDGVSKLAGIPHWLCGEPPSLQSSKCSKCSHALALILTADCPISDDFDRILYLFVCPNCGGDARVFRQKRPAPDPRAAAASPLFTADSLTRPTHISARDLLAALPEPPPPSARRGAQKKPRKQREVGQWPGIYIETFDEPEATIDPEVRFEMSSSVDSAGGEDDDSFRPSVVVDPVLVEYNTRISREPAQVLRYCRFGAPLLQEEVQFQVPNCPACGAPRVFELELVPTVIYLLDPASEMDFGPILVYTCSEDCGDRSCEEFCFVTPP